MPSMSSSDEARRRLRTLSREQLRDKVPLGKAMPGSSRSVSRERCLAEDWTAGEGGSRSCSIRASVSDCMQLSLDGIRNSLRGTSSLLGCQRKKAGGHVSGVQVAVRRTSYTQSRYNSLGLTQVSRQGWILSGNSLSQELIHQNKTETEQNKNKQNRQN